LKYGATGNNINHLSVELDKRQMANRILVFGQGTGSELKYGDASNVQLQEKMGLMEGFESGNSLYDDASIDAYAKSRLTQLQIPGIQLTFRPVQSHEPFADYALGDTLLLDIDWFIYKFTKQLRLRCLNTYVDSNLTETFLFLMSEPKLVRTTPA
jgi:hypothetical protein